ncbi:MAG: hypothetical protein DDT21_01888 [Syntrophomonadaceae bacterium]|nr:hypothetical protein [Bacillota bacterium]
MNFRTTVGVGVAGCLAFIVYSALDMIIQALIVLFWIACVAVIVVAGVVIFTYWQREQTKLYRLIDGAFPLQRFRLLDGTPILVDPNKMISAAGAVHPTQGWGEFIPNGGWDMQSKLIHEVQRTRHLAAMFPGDAAQEKTHGAIKAPKTSAATTKLLTGPTEKAPVVVKEQLALPAPIVVPPVIQRQPMTGQQMIDNPQPTRLAIGENVDSEEIIYWDVLSNPFVRVHGVTGGGKTALCRMLVAQAIRHEWEVTILDTRQGKDWGLFRSHANVIDAREPEVALDAIKQEVAHYEQRDTVLGQYQAADVQELQRISGASFGRRLFVVEEVQSHHINAEFSGGKEYRKAFWMALHKLTKDARATGIHGLYIDQMPKNWAEGVRYNSEAICFELSDYGGRIAGYVYAHKLSKYHCHFRGAIVKAGFLTDSQIMQALAIAPTQVRRVSADTSQGHATPEADTGQTPDSGQADTTHELTEIQRKVAEYVKVNPDAGVRPMARDLGIGKSYAGELREEYLRRPPVVVDISTEKG